MSAPTKHNDPIPSTATMWMLRARELEVELADARAETAASKAETARERLMRSRLAAEIADRNDRTEVSAA